MRKDNKRGSEFDKGADKQRADKERMNKRTKKRYDTVALAGGNHKLHLQYTVGLRSHCTAFVNAVGNHHVKNGLITRRILQQKL